MIKLIVTDFDGTLVPNGRKLEEGVDPKVKMLLGPWIKNKQLMIATGRHPSFISKVIPDLKVDSIIGFSGNLTWLNNKIYAHFFNRKEIYRFIDFASAFFNVEVFMCNRWNDYYFYSKLSKEKQRKENALKNRRLNDIRYIKDEIISDLLETEKNAICRICFRISDSLMLEKFIDSFGIRFDNYSLVKTGDTLLEVRATSVNKASEIIRIINDLKIKEDEVVVIGDSDNDIEMLKHFKNSFYVGEKNTSISKVAKYQCEDLYEALKIIMTLGGEHD